MSFNYKTARGGYWHGKYQTTAVTTEREIYLSSVSCGYRSIRSPQEGLCFHPDKGQLRKEMRGGGGRKKREVSFTGPQIGSHNLQED